MSIKKLGINRPFFLPTHHRKLHEIIQLTENPLTCPIERAVLVSVQADHLTDGPNVVPQHDALSLHHEEVCVGWRKDQKREEAVKALRIRRRNDRGRWRSSRMRREGAIEGNLGEVVEGVMREKEREQEGEHKYEEDNVIKVQLAEEAEQEEGKQE